MKDADSNSAEVYKSFNDTDIDDLNFTIVNGSVYCLLNCKDTLDNILNLFGRN